MQRVLSLLRSENVLLLGPRQTGKSTLVVSLLAPNDLYINLLLHHEFLKYSKNPAAFYQEVLLQFQKVGPFLCVVDEIQKIPELLNDIHYLIETTGVKFILTGSSARKLRAKGTNLLAGRALSRSLYPLIYSEIGNAFCLEQALIFGLLPRLWNGDLISLEAKKDFLSAYAQTYVKEEVQQESLVRKLGAFSRFLDIAAFNDGQIVNYSTIGRDCAVSVKTAQGFYEILEDTLIAYRVDGWSKSVRKQMTSHPKYYFFDCGVSNIFCGWVKEELNSDERRRRFEQFLFLHMVALNKYNKKDFSFFHWRDKTGNEVDFLIVKGMKILAAVEVKSGQTIHSTDLKSLKNFRQDNPDIPCYVVGTQTGQRLLGENTVYSHWQPFLKELFG